jgi:hypothetical protein
MVVIMGRMPSPQTASSKAQVPDQVLHQRITQILQRGKVCNVIVPNRTAWENRTIASKEDVCGRY